MSTARRTVAIVGAGLAGMVAATSAAEHGADVVVLERDDGPGGASADSGGWIWRYRDLATARAYAPHGDPVVQEAIVERLDDALAWLEAHGAGLRTRDMRRAFTSGARVDPRQALAALADRLERSQGDDYLRSRTRVRGARVHRDGSTELLLERVMPPGIAQPPGEWHAFDAVVFAGGGYAADVARVAREATAPDEARAHWVLRSAAAGDGSSLDAALQLGALRVGATGESLTRLVPHGAETRQARMRGGELQVPGARLVTTDGTAIEQPTHDWSGAQAAWTLARTVGMGRLELDRAALRTELHSGGTVEDAVRAAIADGADSGRTGDGRAWLAVQAGITGTRCGLRVDADGRLLQGGPDRRWRRAPGSLPLDGAYAVGIDAACSGLGGTASGLAQGLVLGRAAGAHAATSSRRSRDS